MTDPIIRPEILAHYGRYEEANRLSRDFGELELVRTQDILRRVLPPAPAVIVDVGGGPGVYATWLAELGYRVHLVEPVPHHVEQAQQRAATAGVALASATCGAADHIPLGGDEADVVLLMGPLYHLPERPERLAALTEAMRVLRSGGIVVAAAITRFASALDALDSGFIDDPLFKDAVYRTLTSGRHHNPTDNPNYFTTAYFHLPEELRTELAESGLEAVTVYGVESIGWAAGDFSERLQDATLRHDLMELLRAVETEPSLLGMSPHLLALGRVPQEG